MERKVAGGGKLIRDPMEAIFVENLVEERVWKGFGHEELICVRAREKGRVEVIFKCVCVG